MPLAAWLTDRAVRRRTLLIIAFAAEFIVAWGGIALAWRGGIAGVWTAQLGFAFLLALIMAAEPATLAELFPSKFRLSGYSVSFNLGIGLAGGTAPMVATALIATTACVVSYARFCSRHRGSLSDGGSEWPVAKLTYSANAREEPP